MRKRLTRIFRFIFFGLILDPPPVHMLLQRKKGKFLGTGHFFPHCMAFLEKGEDWYWYTFFFFPEFRKTHKAVTVDFKKHPTQKVWTRSQAVSTQGSRHVTLPSAPNPGFLSISRFGNISPLFPGFSWNLPLEPPNRPQKQPQPFRVFFRKFLMSVKFLTAMLGLEMAAPILWAPRISAFFLQENLHVLKIPRFRGGGILCLGGGGSADLIFMGAGIFLISDR